MKRCSKCGLEKPLGDFCPNKGGRDGRRPECKAGHLAERARKYRENPAPHIERVKRWQRENRERYRERQRAYAESGRKEVSDRKSYLKRKYGMTLEQYDAMLDAQGGVRAICRQPRPGERTLHVDHHHETGEVRGLLCFSCNDALGDFRDDAELFRAAADYLERGDELAAAAVLRVRDLVA